MIWGGEGYEDIPNGTIWDGWATGREWEAAGTGLDLWTGGVEFHVYTKQWTGSAWSGSWTEITGAARPVLGFNVNRGVRDWWLGVQPGTATIDLDYTLGESSFSFFLVQKVRLSVDVPSGEKNLFTGFVISTEKTFDAGGYPIIRLQLVDHIGWSAQEALAAHSHGNQTTSWLIAWLIMNYGSGYETGDLSWATYTSGLTQIGTLGTGNFLDRINNYLRGELGVLWVDGSGVYQIAYRGWWNPLPNPVATIGSLDRGSASPTRNDPSLTEAALKFPATISQFGARVSYTSFTWNGASVATVTSASTTGGIGTRQWTDTVQLTVNTDATQGVNTLNAVIPNHPFYTGVFDDSATLFIHTDRDINALEYCATADVTDFVEVAKETQEHVDGRWWVPGHVMGVTHSYTPSTGWDTRLRLDLGLAEADYDPDPE